MKKVTKEQVQKLYEFTLQHYVKHFDVQTELVDHLANDIEVIWKENTMLTFEEARDMSFKKFGVFGFMDVYEERQRVLEKKYFRILWQYAKQWFQLPKILMAISLFIIIYFGIQEFGEIFYQSIFFGVIVMAIVKSIQLNKTIKRHQQQVGKKWLLEDYIFRGPSFNFIVLIFNMINLNYVDLSLHNGYWVVLYSLFLTMIIICSYVTLFVLPSRAEEFLKKQYPEYTLA